MNLSLTTLVERLDDLFFQRATRAFRVASGVDRDAPHLAELPEVARLEAFQVTSELLDSPRVDEAKRARLVLLRRHLARAFVDAQVTEARQHRELFLRDHPFTAGARAWTPDEAARELPQLAGRDNRAAVATERSAQLHAHHSVAVRQLDGTLEAIAALALTPHTFVEELHGRAVGPRLDAARATLASTADAAVDLLGYALKKLDPMLTPRVAAQHDADRASLAPWLFELFRREDLPHAVSRTLGDLGLSPNADGRVTLDTEARPGRDPAAACFELQVPDQIRLLLTPGMGFETWAGWLSAWGVGLHRANVGRALPFVERRLGDRAVVDAVGLLFESFLLEEGWLKRYLRLTNHQAREAARAFAARQLQQLRRTAGLALYSHEAMGRGSWEGLTDEYVPRLSTVMGVEVPRGPALFEVDPFGDQLLRLDAWALQHTLRAHLLERFNEDYWRNPAAGRFLLDLASQGQRDDVLGIARGLGLGAPSLSAAAEQRIAVMGA